MKFTLIPVDQTAVKDGVAYLDLDLSSVGIPANVHALQWKDVEGTIEYTDLKNETITALPEWAQRALAVWQAADDQANAPPPPLTTQQLTERVRLEAGRRIAALGAEYTPEERETWPVQVSEAKVILADATAPAPLLSAIATARGVPIEAMAQLVLTKAQQLAAATGAILATQAVLLAQEPIPDDYADDKHWPALP